MDERVNKFLNIIHDAIYRALYESMKRLETTMLRLVSFCFCFSTSCVLIWFTNTLAGICYQYLLCGAKSKMKEREEGGVEERTRRRMNKGKSYEQPKEHERYNPILILIEQNNS